MKLAVTIDEIVLHGMPGLDRFRVADAVHSRLQQLFSEAFQAGSSRHVVDAGSFRAGAADTPESVGRDIANAIYGSVQQ